MTVTISTVRTKLNNLSEDLVPDEVIQQHIDMATEYINAIKNDDANSTYVENAILVLASLRTYMSYGLAIERATGTLPPAYEEQIAELKEELQQWVRLISDEYLIRSDVVDIPSILDEYV